MFSKHCGPMGFTLVEVVASLVLLSTLLVTILVAHGRLAQQIRGAQQRMDALRAAESLLAEWTAQGHWGASTTEGTIDDQPGLAWRWQVFDSPELAPFDAAIGRLEIVGREGSVLASLDVVTAGGGEWTAPTANFP